VGDETGQLQIRLLLLDWFGVLHGELTKLLINHFRLNEHQQRALAAVNYLSDRYYVPAATVHEVQAKLMTEGDGRPRTWQQAKAWLDENRAVDRQLVAMIDDMRRRGLMVVVASNAATDHRQNLVNQGMLEHFDEIYVSSLIGYTKPNRDYFEFILAQHGVEADQALFIDDSPGNVEGAKLAGLHAALYGAFGDLDMAKRLFARYRLI
jgi:HAD superfamily hydrolase (TIGR01509 family)